MEFFHSGFCRSWSGGRQPLQQEGIGIIDFLSNRPSVALGKVEISKDGGNETSHFIDLPVYSVMRACSKKGKNTHFSDSASLDDASMTLAVSRWGSMTTRKPTSLNRLGYFIAVSSLKSLPNWKWLSGQEMTFPLS